MISMCITFSSYNFVWQAVLTRALGKGEDDIVQHYAAQALDNLSTQLSADTNS